MTKKIKPVALAVVMALVVVGGIHLVPPKTETVEVKVEVDALEVRISKAQEDNKVEVERKTAEYKAKLEAEIKADVLKAYKAEIDAKLKEVEPH